MYVGISPVRISLAGGGTDMPEYYEKYGGSVVSSSISLFTYLMIKSRNDNAFQAFSTDFKIASASNGLIVCILITSASMPISARI